MVRNCRWALALVLCASFLLLGARGALAQTPPPAFSAIDANGVDLSSGRLVLSEVPISIGPSNGGLSREFFDAGTRDPLSGTIVKTQAGETDVYTVSLGGRSYVFNYTDGTFASGAGANGALLGVLPGGTGALFFVMRDGTRAEFSAPATVAAPIASDYGQVLTIRKPSGEMLTYTYVACGAGCNRLQAVTSNLGYMMKYQYVASNGAVGSSTLYSVKAINLAYEYCDPTANGCTTSNTWMSVTLTGQTSGAGSYTVTDSLSRQTTYELTNSKITKITRPGGLIYTISYDAAGRVYTVTAPGSRTWTYTYETLNAYGGLKTTVKDPLDHLRYASVAASGEPLSLVSDQMGQQIGYSNDPATGRRSQVVNSPLGDITDFEYDLRGNLKSAVHYPRPSSGLATTTSLANFPSNCSGTYVNVGCNQPITTTDERGSTTDYVYDPDHGGVIRITGPLNEQGVRPQTRFTYQQLYASVRNSSNALVDAATPVYRLVSTSTCVTGAGVSATNPAPLTTTCGGAANEIKTTYVYGAAGDTKNRQLTSVTVSYGDGSSAVTTSFDYNRFGDLISTDGPNPGNQDKSYARYDNARRLTDVIEADPDGENAGRPANASHFEYHDDDRLKETWTGTAASGASAVVASEIGAIEYDSVTGLKKSEALKVGSTTYALTSFSFDNAGRLECVAQRLTLSGVPAGACSLNTSPGPDGADRITRYNYDSADRVTSIETGVGTAEARTESVSYSNPDKTSGNADDLVHWVTDGKGNRTTYILDGFGRTAEERFPSPTNANTSMASDRIAYGYDAASNINMVTHRNGAVDAISYDLFNRPILHSLTDTHLVYDNLGRLKSAYRGTETPVTRDYDPADRIVSEGGPLGAVTYAYDAEPSGKARRRVTWPGSPSFWVDYVYDHAGALLEIREKGATSGAGLLATFGYDDKNRRQTLTAGNAASTAYAYSASKPLEWLQSLAITPVGGDGVSTTLDYNAAGQLRSKALNNSQYVWSEHYTITRDYLVNGLNQLTQSGDKYVKYNAQGHLKSICGTQSETDCQNAFTYDPEGQVEGAAVTVLSGQSTSTLNSSMAYDVLGRLYQVSANGATTRFLYDGADMIAEYDGANALLRRYVHGQGADEPLVWYEGSGTADRRWMFADYLGSVVAVTGESGAIKLRPDSSKMILTYDEYGVPGASNGGVRFQYTGQAWLPEPALYHYKARAYSPWLGRFLQTDPIGYDDGLNWYAYVGDDPLNATDPTGMDEKEERPKEKPTLVDEIVVKGKRVREWLDQPTTRIHCGPGCSFFGPSVFPPVTVTETNGEALYGLVEEVLILMPGKARTARVRARGGRIPCNCFEAGTPVAVEGGFKPIEKIVVGDKVLSRSDETGETAFKSVVELIPGRERSIWEVTVEVKVATGEVKREVIRTTEEHPFRTQRGKWIEASKLAVGDEVATAEGGAVTILQVQKTTRVAPTYNFEVNDFHTYFVGNLEVWVHNSCWRRIPNTLQEKMAMEAAKGGAGSRIIEGLGDARFKGMEKWQYVVKSNNGANVTVHYVKDPATGSLMDFKVMTSGK